jgi:SAM-dependent methyltransferase
MDPEGKLVRGLDSLGPLAGREVGLLDVPDGPLPARFEDAGIHARHLALSTPLRLEADDESLDAVVSLWSGFQGVDAGDLAEADRVLRPGGRLLVVHDYGRDDVGALHPPDAPEIRLWSRREGPFLRGGFKIRVLHCFWSFSTLDEARTFLADAFGDRGEAVGARLRRPRLAWNVAVYHRSRGGVEPEAGDGALAGVSGAPAHRTLAV